MPAFCLDPCLHTAPDRLQGGMAALSEALANVDKASVKSLGISGQQHGFVPVDKDGEVSMNHAPSTGADCLHSWGTRWLDFDLIPGPQPMRSGMPQALAPETVQLRAHHGGETHPGSGQAACAKLHGVRHAHLGPAPTCKNASCSCAQDMLMAGAGGWACPQYETCPF